ASNPMGAEILVGGSSQGCDSIINVALTFFPEAPGSLNLELCEGESILVNGTTYDASNPSGTEVLAGASINGCDSILQVAVSFLANTQSNLDLTLCPDESIMVNGTTYDATNPTGTEVLAGANMNGCDSIIQVNLTYFEAASAVLNLSLCEGEAIIVNGTTYDQSNPSGTEVLVGASSEGCDSTIQVTVAFLPPATSDLNFTICENENIIFNGTTYDASNPSGTEILTGGAFNGC
ncbi:MAG: hypothetical protein KDC44_21075, partial [Phaeodactylibacter sp.]|nr:hypothetical protein [Phaeodactylibacter sp.]